MYSFNRGMYVPNISLSPIYGAKIFYFFLIGGYVVTRNKYPTTGNAAPILTANQLNRATFCLNGNYFLKHIDRLASWPTISYCYAMFLLIYSLQQIENSESD